MFNSTSVDHVIRKSVNVCIGTICHSLHQGMAARKTKSFPGKLMSAGRDVDCITIRVR